MLVVYAVVLGLLDGCVIGLMSIVTFECTDRDKMSEAWGGVLMIQSFSMLLGAPAAGENTILSLHGLCLAILDQLRLFFFSISWFIIRVVLLHPLPSLFLPGLLLTLCFSSPS